MIRKPTYNPTIVSQPGLAPLKGYGLMERFPGLRNPGARHFVPGYDERLLVSVRLTAGAVDGLIPGFSRLLSGAPNAWGEFVHPGDREVGQSGHEELGTDPGTDPLFGDSQSLLRSRADPLLDCLEKSNCGRGTTGERGPNLIVEVWRPICARQRD